MVQSLWKNWLLVSKITWGISTTSDKQWKVQWTTFVQKILFLQLNHIEDLSNITFNYLCENSPNSLCHYETIIHFSGHNSSVLFFCSNITYFLQKQHTEVQMLWLATARIKIRKIPHVIFQQKLRFSSNFASLFSVIRHNSSVLFHLNLYMLWRKAVHQSANLEINKWKLTKFIMSFFKPTSEFSNKFWITLHFQCHDT